MGLYKILGSETIDSRNESDKDYEVKVIDMKKKANEIKQYLIDDNIRVKKY